MCGFVGYLAKQRCFEVDLMGWSSLIEHRGPDQAGAAVSGEFGIGTRRLSILDLSEAGNQPMESGRYILGFNGEIYNHLSVREELSSAAEIQFVSMSDTETVLRAIEHWGVIDALARLNGIYALAVWDKQKEELALARDPLGVKPLFYMETGDALLFGSEMRALRPYASGRLSTDAVAMYLYFGFVPAPFCLLDGAHKVRAGEVVTFTGSTKRSTQLIPRFWEIKGVFPERFEERVSLLKIEVEAAVLRQLQSDVPVGIFLSGGVDSTIIASIAARQSAMTSFSLRPTALHRDPTAHLDADFAAAYAARLGFDHHEVIISPDDVTSDLLQMVNVVDEPVAELYTVGEVLLSRRSRREGIKVVLTGHGGDEVFMGYPTYAAVTKGDLHNRIPMFGPALRAAARTSIFSPEAQSNLLGAASVWRQPLESSYAIVSGVHFSVDEVARLTGKPIDDIREMVQGVVCSASAATHRLPHRQRLSNAERHARMDLMLMVPEHYNNRLDRASMGASVEARVPFQDLQLLGYVMRLSEDDLMRGGLKGMLKQTFADILPEEIRSRRKQTFQAPVLSWTSGDLAPWIRTQLSSSPLRTQEMNLLANESPGTTRDAYRQWSIAFLEGWRNALALDF